MLVNDCAYTKFCHAPQDVFFSYFHFENFLIRIDKKFVISRRLSFRTYLIFETLTPVRQRRDRTKLDHFLNPAELKAVAVNFIDFVQLRST